MTGMAWARGLASVLTVSALLGAAPARDSAGGRVVAAGVVYRVVDVPSGRGTARVHLLTVDLREPGVAVGLLHAGAVAARERLSVMAGRAGAVAGVNGDFFHMMEGQHPGVPATGAAVGPVVAAGRAVKGAVPRGQRFGPRLPPGASGRLVLGVDWAGRAAVRELELRGEVLTPGGRLRLGGLNQYALPVGSVGVFTSEWGSASRLRAVCGTDTVRGAPCSGETYEVMVRAGRVVATARVPGTGRIGPATRVLVGREAGARALRRLAVGDRVGVRYRLAVREDPGAAAPAGADASLRADATVRTASGGGSGTDGKGRTGGGDGAGLRFAVGGFRVLRGGEPVPGLDAVAPAVRTAAGVAGAGHRLLLLALDNGPGFRGGLTLVEAARLLRGLGASEGVNLDGGGSSTLVALPGRGTGAVSVLNHPTGGVERPVPNGIGVFVRR
ncbi:phosphodiester glycosidase family protein [Streptomyces sp. CC53]|uniref:phosphodiester glycosidase family protein n=2 Tax=unclassified Streptomyces TaxID=2593676 RepID=UPI000AA79E43|nr:phosphodiester glycosidase family protein [Streptomyces sp. CC53]